MTVTADTDIRLAVGALVIVVGVVVRAVERGGSVSAEHGLGQAKAAYLGLGRNPNNVVLMQQVPQRRHAWGKVMWCMMVMPFPVYFTSQLKQLMDPHGILNPKKVFPL